MTMSGTPYLDPKDKAEAIDKKSPSGAPEAVNRSQNDEPSQAQTVGTQAQNKTVNNAPTDPTSQIDPAQITPQDKPDVVEKMQQMQNTGIIDSNAYDGERNDADAESPLGKLSSDNSSGPKISGK